MFTLLLWALFSLLPPTLLLLILCSSFKPVIFLLLLLYCFFHPSAYKWIHGELRGNIPLQYLAWVSYPLMFILFSSIFCHLVSPQAIGLYLPMLHCSHLTF